MKKNACYVLMAVMALVFCLAACSEDKAGPTDSGSTAPAEKAAAVDSGAQPSEKKEEDKVVPERENPAPAQDSATPEQGDKGNAEAQPSAEAGEKGETVADSGVRSEAITEKDLLHKRFELQSINGAAHDYKDVRPSLEFNEDFRLAGEVCNRFMGPGTLENGVLSAKHMAATKKFCFEEAVNKLEMDFFALLNNGAVLEFDGQRLVLSGKGVEDPIVLEYKVSDRVQ